MGIRIKKKGIAALLTGVCLMMCVTGCAENQIPELTDSQIDEVKDYVAATVMKYNMGRQSRLVDLSKYSDMGAAPEILPEETGGMPPVDDTPVINSGETDKTEDSESESVSWRMEEVLEFPEGVNISFLDYVVCESYPEEDEEGIFYVGASEGKRLLVLRFSLTNTTEQEQSVDMNFPQVTFPVTVNEEYTRKALTTWLPNDLFTFQDTLSGGGSSEVVLVIEVPEEMEGSISSIDLGVQKDSKIYHFQLL